MFEEFDRISNAIAQRAFEIFHNDGIFGRDLDNWFKAEAELLHPVNVNLTETDNSMTVQAELPGFTTKDIEIRLEPRRLTISGKRETKEEHKEGKAIYQEHRSNEVLRMVELPSEADTEKATASLKDGILELQIPKSPKASGVRIEVKSV